MIGITKHSIVGAGYSIRCYTSVKLVQQSKIIRQSHSVTQV